MKTALIAIAAAASTVAGVADAATIITSRAAFTAQGAGTSYSNDFNGFTAPTDAPFTFGPYTATGSIRGQAPGTAGVNGNVNGTGWVQMRLDVGLSGTLSSSAAFRLLGFDFRAYQGDEDEVVSYLTNTGETGTFAMPSTATAGFLGFLFDVATTSVTFSATTGGADASTWFGIDDFQSYSAVAGAAVPEPASWALMILGVGAIGGTLRRRNGRVATTVRFA